MIASVVESAAPRGAGSSANGASAKGPSARGRRILALVLPQLLVELAAESARVRLHGASARDANFRDARRSSVRRPGEPEKKALAVVLKAEREAPSTPSTGWLPGLAEVVQQAELQPKTRIDAVNHRAHQFGVRAGQTVAEARALVSELVVHELPVADVRAALERIAESLTRFASVVSIDRSLEASGGPAQARSKGKGGKQSPGVVGGGTLWLDITGIGHLFGGERELAREVLATVQKLGHRARVAVASGPVLARAFARWPARDQAVQVLSPEEVKAAVRWLPITALPVAAETQTWLARLGVLTFADLEKIPRHLTASRLGKEGAASRVLDLLRGEDDEPLDAYVPRALPCESVHWDEPVTGCEPLSFALRGLVAKVCSRLGGRGLAARRLRLTVTGDRAIARFRGASADWHGDFELVVPLYRAEELFRVMSPRLSSARLGAPSVGLRLEVQELAERKERQLSLVDAELELDGTTPEKMAVLFGGLAAEIGAERFGVLRLVDSHRPERCSVLGSLNGGALNGGALNGGALNGGAAEAGAASVGLVKGGARGARRLRSGRRKKRNEPGLSEGVRVEPLQGLLPGMEGRPSNDVAFGDESTPPTRLFNPPLEISATAPSEGADAALAVRPFEPGAELSIGPRRYTVERVDFIHRLEGVEWWSRKPTSRDYYRLWLSHPTGALDALVFVELSTGKGWVQGFYD